MSIRRWTLVILVALLVIATASVVVFAGREPSVNPAPAASNGLQPADSTAQQANLGNFRWVYSVKFVCGFQRVDDPATGVVFGEPPVKSGNYATEINIHNYNFSTSELRKKVVLLVRPSVDGKDQDVVREPRTTGPLTNAAGKVQWEAIKLEKDFATMDDCNKFWQWTYPGTQLPTPFPLMIGYLVIYSSLDLDVDAVYTAAAPGLPGVAPQSISIDVERVPGKRVFVPLVDTQ